MDKKALIQQLRTYQSQYRAERHYVPRFISLLRNFPSCFDRSLLSGHITASSFIICNARHSVLLVHHKKLNKWLQPGGHADGEEDVLQVATREATEETGLHSLQLVSSGIFDIDIHVIPRHKDIKPHFHYDIRYLFEADPAEEVHVSHESHAVAWIPLNSIDEVVGANPSIERMCAKVFQL